MRNSRLSRISRVSEWSAGGIKKVSVVEAPTPKKQFGARSPRCLGPSSPFAYLKEPDNMNVLPLDGKAGRLCMIPVQNSTFNRKRRHLDATLEAVSRDLEHITILFQEITPEAPSKADSGKVVPKETGIQLLESVLEWLKAASFDLIWAKTAIEERDLDNSYETVQVALYDSLRSLDKLRSIHNRLMHKFNDYIRSARLRNAVAEQKAAEKPAESLSPTPSSAGLNYRALSTEVVELLQKERARTAETYESRLNSLNVTLTGQAALIKKLTESLKTRPIPETPRGRESKIEVKRGKERESKTEAGLDDLFKKTARHKKKFRDAEDESESESTRPMGEDSAKEPKHKDLLSLQKTLHTCQTETTRLVQQNRLLLETKNQLTTANAHKDKVIGELKSRLLLGGLADKPKLDNLVVPAPSPTRAVTSQERPVSPRSRFIYVDSAEKGGSAGPSTPEPPARSKTELLTPGRAIPKLYLDDDDTPDSGEAAAKHKKSGDVRDTGMSDKGEKAKKSVSGDLENMQSEKPKKSLSVDLEKVQGGKAKKSLSGDLENVQGGKAKKSLSGNVEMVQSQKAKKSISGDLEKMRSEDKAEMGDVSKDGAKTPRDVDKAEKQAGAREPEKMAADRSGGRADSGPDGQGAVEGKGRDRKGKDGRVSQSSSAVGVDGVGAGEKVGGLKIGREKELKGAEDRAGGRSRERSTSRGSAVAGQEAHELGDRAMGQKSKQMLSAGGIMSSEGALQAASQKSDHVGDSISKLDKDDQKSGRVIGKGGLTDATAQRSISPGMAGQDPASMMIGGTRGKPMAGAEKESEMQLKGSASSGERLLGKVVGSQVSDKDGIEKGVLMDSALGVSGSDRAVDQLARDRHGSPVQGFGSGMGGLVSGSGKFGSGMSRPGSGMGGIGSGMGGIGSGMGGLGSGTGKFGSGMGGPGSGIGGLDSGMGGFVSGVGGIGSGMGGIGSGMGGPGSGMGGFGTGMGRFGGRSPELGDVSQKGGLEGKGPGFGAADWRGGLEGKGPGFGDAGWKGGFEGKGPGLGAADWKGGFEGKGPGFGAASWKGMPDMGANVDRLPAVRPDSAGQQTSGMKYDLSSFMPQHMGQRSGWLACEKEGVDSLTEDPMKSLRVIGETAVHPEKGPSVPCTKKQHLLDTSEMARVLRSYEVDLNDPRTFTHQLEFIKHSGTVDGLKQAMRLLAPYLKLLEDNDQQGENVLMEVMRSLQRRHAELIAEEFQPATDLGTPKHRRLFTFVTDRRRDICSLRARQRLLTQGQARGLVHLKPLLGHETKPLSPCPPHRPAGYMDTQSQKVMRDTFASHHKAPRQQQMTSARCTKLRPGNEYATVGMTIDNLLKTIDRLAKYGQATSV